MKRCLIFAAALVAVVLSCAGGPGETDPWDAIKSGTSPSVADTAEFDPPYRQPLATMGWEDGVHISRDGLDLYCTYLPLDALSWMSDPDPEKVWEFSAYLRGPLAGMDLVTNPLSKPAWLHWDILYSHRTAASAAFPGWTDLNTGTDPVSESVYTEGAPFAFGQTGDDMEAFLVTSNKREGSDIDIFAIIDTARPPGGVKVSLGFNTTTYNEDNPAAERLQDSTIILMFDSPDYPGGQGGLDIWYTIGSADAASWSAPANLSGVNTAATDHQPHLFRDADNYWWLYFSSVNPGDGKLAIFRTRRTSAGDPAVPGDWAGGWGPRELVLGSGNAAGVGEPTLTANGDISFVVVYDRGPGDPYDRYDADPWFLPKKQAGD